MTPTDKVLSLDLDNLSQEDIDWLHKLRNLAATMQGRIMLKKMKEEERNDGL
jgi:hypothetical protein